MDRETVEAIRQLLKPMQNQLEDLTIKIDTMRLEMKTSERSIRKDIHFLNDEMETLIGVLEAKGILPKVE
ncbi:MAG: hypothetical protein SPJ50_02205 [Ligilactobacillus salivarius]|uniref:Uncharacterized protein n=1 Tax=Clostridium porci TaxID=2605778 RepID=A0A7X2NPN4_9CLOT|nr:hypothetical protein [Clostridium porci]MDY5246413.1 hypothetical protein [Ligilactobacillus salivarius]MSS38745.1 hypothetical protein [Clostridium porci]